MKRYILQYKKSLVFFVWLISCTAFGQGKLEVAIKLYNFDNIELKESTAYLETNNVVVDSTTYKRHGLFFKLPLDSNFVIRLITNGYPNSFVLVDSHLPKEQQKFDFSSETKILLDEDSTFVENLAFDTTKKDFEIASFQRIVLTAVADTISEKDLVALVQEAKEKQEKEALLKETPPKTEEKALHSTEKEEPTNQNNASTGFLELILNPVNSDNLTIENSIAYVEVNNQITDTNKVEHQTEWFIKEGETDTTFVKNTGFFFKFPYNEEYKINVQAEGYPNSFIAVNTHTSEKENSFNIIYNLPLKKDNSLVENEPLMKIFYDENMKYFTKEQKEEAVTVHASEETITTPKMNADSMALFGAPHGVEYELLYEVHHIPTKGFNTGFSEFSPVIFDNQLVYTSDRDYHFHSMGEDAWGKTKFFNLFAIDIQKLHDTTKFAKPRLFAHELLINDNLGPITFSKDGKEAYITAAPMKRKHRKTDHHLHLYKSDLVKGKWTNLELLFPQKDYAYGHAAISDDGTQLFFSAEIPGGKGGKDLYSINLKDTANAKPINMGSVFNTEFDEVFPYFHKGELYFSSNRTDGFGGLDLYKSQFKKGKWQEVENIGETINTEADEMSFFYNNDKSKAYFSSNRAGNDDIYYADVVVKVKKRVISGVFEYKNLPGSFVDGLEVQLIDDEGNVIFQTATDETGYFSFENLPWDKNFTIKTVQLMDNIIVKITTEDGEESYLMSNSKGEFLYKKLAIEEVGSLALMEVEDGALMGSISGQFVYDLLPSENLDSLPVYLVDDNGNVVFQTMTDKFGNFEFKDLPTDQNYLIKFDTEADVSVIVYNSKNQAIAELKRNASGFFVYKKLSSQYVGGLALIETEDVELNAAEVVFGQFRTKNNLPLLHPIIFEIYLAETKDFLLKSVTDLKGFFRLTELPIDKELLYKIISEDGTMEDYILVLKDRNGEIIIEMVKGEDSFYYRILEGEENSINAVANKDDAAMELQPEEQKKEATTASASAGKSGVGDKIPEIYFDKNSSYLNNRMRGSLAKVIDLMKNNPVIKVEITTHSDARGDVGYNLWMTERRSQRIAQHLIDNGIGQDRIKTEAKGESDPKTECYSETDCTEEEYRINRIVDFLFF